MIACTVVPLTFTNLVVISEVILCDRLARPDHLQNRFDLLVAEVRSSRPASSSRKEPVSPRDWTSWHRTQLWQRERSPPWLCPKGLSRPGPPRDPFLARGRGSCRRPHSAARLPLASETTTSEARAEPLSS